MSPNPRAPSAADAPAAPNARSSGRRSSPGRMRPTRPRARDRSRQPGTCGAASAIASNPPLSSWLVVAGAEPAAIDAKGAAIQTQVAAEVKKLVGYKTNPRQNRPVPRSRNRDTGGGADREARGLGWGYGAAQERDGRRQGRGGAGADPERSRGGDRLRPARL